MLRYSTVLMVHCTINDTHGIIFAASGLYILDIFEWRTTPCNPHLIENDTTNGFLYKVENNALINSFRPIQK